ncbi:Mitochondrial fusion and transport protein ugo1 [Sphaceloma murrayae]|uniref:Mitochondrial fusion and transport protein ugo1 n=1 Tax=Sphaceloma murrayae TaxID=2082308 RepID=A0A2K1QH84_9PEZI|nr:Mitochondrial fusion and transport protein ugo1 [Sphaceloma murrayae]
MSKGEAPTTEDTGTEKFVSDEGATLKRKAKTEKPNAVISQFTVREPDWAYVQLKLVTPSSLQANVSQGRDSDSSRNLDDVTAYLHLQSALDRFLGIHGTAISLDILKIDGRHVWTRVPREDCSAVVAAAGGWVGHGGEGWRVVGWGCWGPSEGDDGLELFN